MTQAFAVPRHPWRRRLLAVVIATAAMLLLAEGAVRLFLPHVSYEAWRAGSLRYTYDPRWHWTLVPCTYTTEHGPLRVGTQGLRGPDIVASKPAGRLRVVCLGGSSTFCYHETRAWPEVLEKDLQQRLGEHVEVVNGGTPGYSSLQSSQRFEHQFAGWDPDLVIVYHLWNDLKSAWMDDAGAITRRWDNHGRKNASAVSLAPSAWDDLCAFSQLVTHLRFAWINHKIKSKNVATEGWQHETLDKQPTRAGIAFFRDNLGRVARLCAERSVPLLVVDQIFVPSENTHAYTGLDAEAMQRAILMANDAIAGVARQSNVHRLETADLPRDAEHLHDHVHLKQRGIEALAGRIAPRAVELLEED